MPNKGTVFVGADFILDRALNLISASLADRGYKVVRGPAQKPPVKTVFPPADWPRFFGETDVIVVTTRSIIPREILEIATRLRGVVFPTIGTESIDIEAAKDLGIVVANGATAENFNSMAEATVMLITLLSYKPYKSEQVLRENLARPTVMFARMVMGKTIGLIGLGRIARGVVERLAGWHVHILATDPFVSQSAAPDGVAMVDLNTLLRESDVVSLHTTLTPDTHHLIGAAQLELMKPTAYLVNTSRGGVVDEAALYQALKKGRIAGAALDAFQKEPLPPESPLRELDNVILTPHLIGHTEEAIHAIPPTAVENVERILRGKLPLFITNPEVVPRWRERLAAIEKLGICSSS